MAPIPFATAALCVFAALSAIETRGCIGSTDCTDEAVVSVIVLPVDDSGFSIPADDVTVLFRAGGESTWNDCSPWPSREWACGYEVRGDIEIQAVTADAASEIYRTTVSGDDCHVDTRTLEVVVGSR